ncbi:helix-turn-helix domain-containing protein [Spiroplasma endosymbiont of Poecilobothrus nobilitatus]|uniref:helix-turn-helix domain-containing protein n=1 Tax=Spiroplasma endosymbiont of Poecilobothrus nobilitatus TaxID=1209220 RepID=UPI003CC7AE05
MVKEYLENKITIKAQTILYNISSPTLQKWIKNYKIYGKNGLRNISFDQTRIKELEAKLRLSQQEI